MTVHTLEMELKLNKRDAFIVVNDSAVHVIPNITIF